MVHFTFFSFGKSIFLNVIFQKELKICPTCHETYSFIDSRATWDYLIEKGKKNEIYQMNNLLEEIEEFLVFSFFRFEHKILYIRRLKNQNHKTQENISNSLMVIAIEPRFSVK